MQAVQADASRMLRNVTVSHGGRPVAVEDCRRIVYTGVSFWHVLCIAAKLAWGRIYSGQLRGAAERREDRSMPGWKATPLGQKTGNCWRFHTAVSGISDGPVAVLRDRSGMRAGKWAKV